MIVTDSVAVQPLSSVTVQVYVPATKEVKSSAFAAFPPRAPPLETAHE